MKIKETKCYTLKECKEFCEEAFICPPLEDDEEVLDEWFETHKVHIIVNDCDMELEYDADTINNIEFTLKEIYNDFYGNDVPTTNNNVESQRRPATIVDLMKAYIDYRVSDGGTPLKEAIWSFIQVFDFEKFEKAKQHAERSELLELIDCDFSKLDITQDFPITSKDRKKLVEDTLCTNCEVSYDSSADRSYIVDFTFMPYGDLVGFTWGSDESSIQYAIEQYKSAILR